jgi:hypothetical protein
VRILHLRQQEQPRRHNPQFSAGALSGANRRVHDVLDGHGHPGFRVRNKTVG